MSIEVYFRKEERFEINAMTFHLENLTPKLVAGKKQ
jgi:hypothetical protein